MTNNNTDSNNPPQEPDAPNQLNNIINTKDWNECNKQKEKILNYYNTVIKPTLKRFYSMTGKDIELEVTEDEHNKIYLGYKPTDNIIWYYPVNYPKPIDGPYAIGYTYRREPIESHVEYTEYYNIEVISVFVRYWSRLSSVMNERVCKCLNDYKDIKVD